MRIVLVGLLSTALLCTGCYTKAYVRQAIIQHDQQRDLQQQKK